MNFYKLKKKIIYYRNNIYITEKIIYYRKIIYVILFKFFQCKCTQMLLTNIRIFKKKNHSKVKRSIQSFGLKQVHGLFTFIYKCSLRVHAMFTTIFECSRLIANVHGLFKANCKCSRLVYADVLMFTPFLCSRMFPHVYGRESAMLTWLV